MNPIQPLRPYISLLVPLLSLILSGCLATTVDIDRLSDSLKKMQNSQADLIVKMDELDRSLIHLREKLDENQKKMGLLGQKLDDTQSRLGKRMELISQLLSQATTYASLPVPGDLYRTAYGDYRSGKIGLAMSEFKSFLERYPDSDLADASQFYLADCYLMEKNFVQARIEFDKVLSTSREFRPLALLKRSYALAELKKVDSQKETLKTLINEFPDSPEAQTAKEILRDLDLRNSSQKSPQKSTKPSPKNGFTPEPKR